MEGTGSKPCGARCQRDWRSSAESLGNRNKDACARDRGCEVGDTKWLCVSMSHGTTSISAPDWGIGEAVKGARRER